ncbi:hypothetical protein FD06_GL000440 [Apilactobacillus ozensis DSM 23829 = JCM 17196]|uniref:Proton-coupled thiamine transporter YuaJ n=1 Tax=Apilactobacillus ozensis DSM 23829 = JCM 17196 TaxID=1423781 RepID=A0A0R2AUY3_9LACO|nr:energy-coupled thiamine transporter ThiT [Apilactobacillus ozensis]KRM67721.1 hypothetical protein FD06_GL000440 [Apilactobacillus ozensis DSM 23829 = JCM 17196]
MINIKTKKMTEMVISASLALILHYVAIIQLPQGGNISLVMAPILFIALKNGVVDGCVCGLIVGIFSLVFGGFFLSPLQVLCDYFLAFSAIGLGGLCSHQFINSVKNNGKVKIYLIISSLISGLGCLIFHTIAGVAFYDAYAPKGINIFWYALTYNSIYVIPDTIVAAICIYVLTGRAKNILLK